MAKALQHGCRGIRNLWVIVDEKNVFFIPLATEPPAGPQARSGVTMPVGTIPELNRYESEPGAIRL